MSIHCQSIAFYHLWAQQSLAYTAYIAAYAHISSRVGAVSSRYWSRYSFTREGEFKRGTPACSP